MGVFLLCLGTLKGIPVGTIISHMASQKQNKTKKGQREKKEREEGKKIKGLLDALAQHRKGENPPWRIQLTQGELETHDQSNRKLRTSSSPVKTI